MGIRRSLGYGLVVALAGVGCSGDDEVAETGNVTETGTVPDTETEEPPDPNAYVRVIHLIPDIPVMDLATNGSSLPLAEDFPYPGSSPFILFPQATYSFQFHEPNTDTTGDNTTGEVIVSFDGYEVSGGRFYTAGGWGFASDGSAQRLELEDDLTPASEGNFKARVVHACTICGPVDIWTLDGATPVLVFDDLGPGEATDYIEIPADEDQVWLFDMNGDANPDWQLEAFQFPAVDTQGNGQVINMFLQPLIDPSTGIPIFVPGQPVVGPWIITQPIDASAETQAAIFPPT